ncbi:septal ring lytic transglycosylase RlpA family protein [Fodinibius roseus]|nr:septal ring lytic transglycosylase RlpA family protein [Fodinibius roseus]
MLDVKYIGQKFSGYSLQRVAQKLSYLFIILAASMVISSCGTLSRTKDTEPEKTPEIDFPDAGIPGKKIEEGMASWYGPKFQGRLTANGEQYDMDQLTAAHRTLPFNSIVRVQNLANGESVMVRINDRGPFAKNRIIDLSRKAARQIGMIGPGTAKVALILMNGSLEHSSVADLKTPTYTVQLGSFRDESKAFELSRKIRGSRVKAINHSKDTVHRVYYGTFIEKAKARQKKQELRERGFNGYVKQIQN